MNTGFTTAVPMLDCDYGLSIPEENVSLIREINDLRREINALKHERQAQDEVEQSDSHWPF